MIGSGFTTHPAGKQPAHQDKPWLLVRMLPLPATSMPSSFENGILDLVYRQNHPLSRSEHREQSEYRRVQGKGKN